jgi:hypothetical protein
MHELNPTSVLVTKTELTKLPLEVFICESISTPNFLGITSNSHFVLLGTLKQAIAVTLVEIAAIVCLQQPLFLILLGRRAEREEGTEQPTAHKIVHQKELERFPHIWNSHLNIPFALLGTCKQERFFFPQKPWELNSRRRSN